MTTMQIRDLFASDVTRAIAPVVYFHEQSPEKLEQEVAEYIVTGGWPEDHPNHKRVPSGIHEQYVGLLRAIVEELKRPGGPDLPTAWISGFYGSGKSSFAKLLGLALDGVALPDGSALSEAWLRRDTSPKAQELRDAWAELRTQIDPMSVVFDVGSVARDGEQVHSAALRQVQRRLGYCSTEPLVADFELKLERDGEWDAFRRKAQETLGQPWDEVKDRQLAEEDFSLVLSELYPERYPDPMAWYTSRGGTHSRSESPEEAVAAIRDMIRFRAPKATLFLVVDEVSQYVLGSKDRTDRLRAFATALGANLKGRVWLLALGQQKLDQDADDSFLVWAKDRFPPKLRVHLAATNIRDVVHKRLLQKKPDAESALRDAFERHRSDLKLFAYGCESVTAEEFVEVYPLVPGQIDLILQITSSLRTRSRRAQGDDQAIRGLLQLLGELFRGQRLAEREVGELVTIDAVYEVQNTALDSDAQTAMARILDQCAKDGDPMLVRVAKAVAMLELVQETMPTDVRLVAQCLYDRVGRGSMEGEVRDALEELRRRNLLGYAEKTGYKLQSSAGEEWERERRDLSVSREQISDIVQKKLAELLAEPDRPRLQGRPFPWGARFSDGRRVDDVVLHDPRDAAAVTVDFRFLVREDRDDAGWLRQSAERSLAERVVWVCGDTQLVEQTSRELLRSEAMVRKYDPRQSSMLSSRKMLLLGERDRSEELHRTLRDAVAACWMEGRLYLRGRALDPSDHGTAFAPTLHAVGTRALPEFYPHFVSTLLTPQELGQLLSADLSGPSPKYLREELGILDVHDGRYEVTCAGVVPQRVLEQITADNGMSGMLLLARFGGPPYGYASSLVKASVLGLLRAGRVRIVPESGAEMTSFRDAGTREILEKETAFRRATIFPAGEDAISPSVRARICRFFEANLDHKVERENAAIADAVNATFPRCARELRELEKRFDQLPGRPDLPKPLVELQAALEACLQNVRQTKPTVTAVSKNLDALHEGVVLLRSYLAELTEEVLGKVRAMDGVVRERGKQLEAFAAVPSNVAAALARLREQLASERPWRDLSALQDDVMAVQSAYRSAREELLASLEDLAEQARIRVKGEPGFATLTGDQSHHVLRPIATAVPDTGAEAVAPTLDALRSGAMLKLQEAEEEARNRLRELVEPPLRPDPPPPADEVVVRVAGPRRRLVRTEAEVTEVVDEFRRRLLEVVRRGETARID